MDTLIIFFLILIIVGLILLWGANCYNRFQEFIIRANAAEANIDSTLRKRYDLLNKSINIIKKHTKEKNNILESIDKMKSKKLSNFELDRQLYESINEFNKYKENEELSSNEEFLKIDLSLFESESEIVAARKYYNDIITDYNKLVRTLPAMIVAKVSKYPLKNYFDGKDMNDEDIKDFKL